MSTADPWEIGPIRAGSRPVAHDRAAPAAPPTAEPSERTGVAEPIARPRPATHEGNHSPVRTADPWEIRPIAISSSRPMADAVASDTAVTTVEPAPAVAEKTEGLRADVAAVADPATPASPVVVRSLRFAAAGVMGLALMACVAYGGVNAWRAHAEAEHAAALADARTGCVAARDGLLKSRSALEEYLHGDEYTAATALSEDKLSDPSLLDGLDPDIDLDATIDSCRSDDPTVLDDARVSFEKTGKRYDRTLASLRKKVKLIDASVQKKALTDASKALNEKLGKARTLLASSAGHVKTGDGTRKTLSSLIDAAAKALDAEDTTADTLSDHVNRLDAAMKQVENAVREQSEADRKQREREQTERDATADTDTSVPVTPTYPQTGSTAGGNVAGQQESSSSSSSSNGSGSASSGSSGWDVPSASDPSLLPDTDPSL